MTQKTCFKCNQVKNLSEFYKHPQMGDGHLNKCKECTKKDVAENYADKREQYAEYEQKRFQDPARKAKAIAYQKKRRAINHLEYAATGAVAHALRGGRIRKQPCEICGDPNTEAHHPDYSKPLDVRWLCREHHLAVHGKQAYKFQEKEVSDPLLISMRNH